MGTPDLGSRPSSVLTPGQLQTQLGHQAWQPAPGRQGGYLQTGSTSAETRGLGPCLSPGSLFLPPCARPLEAPRGPCAARPLQNPHLQPPPSAPGSQSPELSMGSPELRSSSRGLCIGCLLLHPQGLRAALTGPSPLCLLADAAHPVSSGVWPYQVSMWPLWSPVTVGSQRRQGPASIWVRSGPRVQNPVAPEVLAAPPSPSPTAIPLPLLHAWPQVGTAWCPGQEAPPVEIPPALPHGTEAPFAQSSPEGHFPRNFILSQPSPRMCLRGRQLQPGPEPLLLLKVARVWAGPEAQTE